MIKKNLKYTTGKEKYLSLIKKFFKDEVSVILIYDIIVRQSLEELTE